jgi:hypothetical protein
MVPASHYPEDAIQHGPEGIEIKGSRYKRGWQGHNAEEAWLMVFVFDSNTSRDAGKGIGPRPFKFIKVVGAKLLKRDWQFSQGERIKTCTDYQAVHYSGQAGQRRINVGGGERCRLTDRVLCCTEVGHGFGPNVGGSALRWSSGSTRHALSAA